MLLSNAFSWRLSFLFYPLCSPHFSIASTCISGKKAENQVCSVAAFSTGIAAGFVSILEISGSFHFGRKNSYRDAQPQRFPNHFLPAIIRDKTRIFSLRAFAPLRALLLSLVPARSGWAPPRIPPGRPCLGCPVADDFRHSCILSFHF
ncbi:MAG: hypothetical protein DKINENOH_05647 [bacterium]|nr:hypothetical protein [bacterium]